MNLTQWYAVSIAAIAGCILLYRIGIVSSAFLTARFQYIALKNLAYPLLIPRRYNWKGVTRLQGAVLGGYFGINGFCMGLGITSRSELMARSGMLASINLIPLFLGGRTSVLANFLGISLHTYYIAHHWIGRLVILQGLLHVGLAITSGRPWTFDSFQISGISSASALALIFLSSLFFIRRMMYEIFLKIHFWLSIIAVIALLKHLLPMGLGKSIFPIVAMSLWGCNTALRLAIMAYHNLGGRLDLDQAKIVHRNAFLRMTVHLRRPLEMRPEQYFYLFFSDMGIRRQLQAHPYVVAWWDDTTRAKELSFLINPQDGISSELNRRKSISSVVLDGPYGKALRLEDFETVILIARGIGIAGILPHLRHMTYRSLSKAKEHARYRRGLITRKIDVYWVLEDEDQMAWVQDWLIKLYNKDSEKLFLSFLSFYPSKGSKHPQFFPEKDTHWRFSYGQDPIPIIKDLMSQQIQRSAGKTKVAVCGNSDFASSIREMALESMSQYQGVAFAEVEFQPGDARQVPPVQDESGTILPIRQDHRMKRLTKSGRLLRGSTIPKGKDKAQTQGYDGKVEMRVDEMKKKLIKTRTRPSTKLSVVVESDEKESDGEIEESDEVVKWNDLEAQSLGSTVEGTEIV